MTSLPTARSVVPFAPSGTGSMMSTRLAWRLTMTCAGCSLSSAAGATRLVRWQIRARRRWGRDDDTTWHWGTYCIDMPTAMKVFVHCILCGGDHVPHCANALYPDRCTDDGIDREIKRMGHRRWNIYSRQVFKPSLKEALEQLRRMQEWKP